MTPVEVRAAIGWILTAGSVVPSVHCRRRMRERRVFMQDIEFCLKRGEPAERAVWSEQYSDWKYRMDGLDIEGDPLTLIVVFEIRSRLMVVTVF